MTLLILTLLAIAPPLEATIAATKSPSLQLQNYSVEIDSVAYSFDGTSSCADENVEPRVHAFSAGATDFERRGVECTDSANEFGSNGWPVEEPSDTQYVGFLLLPAPQSRLVFTPEHTLAFSVMRSAPGPVFGSVLMALNGGEFVELGAWDLTTRADSQIVFSLRDTSAIHSAEFRFQAWGGPQQPDSKLWFDGVVVTFRSELIVGTERPASQLIRLLVAYPNPFGNEATFLFDVNEYGIIRIEVYDILARRVELVREKIFPVGRHEVIWDAKALPTGTYLISLVDERGHRINKIVFRK